MNEEIKNDKRLCSEMYFLLLLQDASGRKTADRGFS